MLKFLKFTEYLYLIVAIVSVVQIVMLWETERDRAYIFVFFAVISAFMFWFRRRYRQRFDANKEER